jgi:hypothetical protein
VANEVGSGDSAVLSFSGIINLRVFSFGRVPTLFPPGTIESKTCSHFGKSPQDEIAPMPLVVPLVPDLLCSLEEGQFMPGEMIREMRGIFENGTGSGICWIRDKIDGTERREKAGHRGDTIRLCQLRNGSRTWFELAAEEAGTCCEDGGPRRPRLPVGSS